MNKLTSIYEIKKEKNRPKTIQRRALKEIHGVTIADMQNSRSLEKGREHGWGLARIEEGWRIQFADCCDKSCNLIESERNRHCCWQIQHNRERIPSEICES